MGFFDKVKDFAEESLDVSADIVTLGQKDKIKDLIEDEGEEALVTFSTGGLNKVKEKQDEKKAKEAAARAAAEAEKKTIQEKQEKLRTLEFEKAVSEQSEAEQLAQRALFRESQALSRRRTQLEVSSQQSSASLQNLSAQSGIRSSSVVQSMAASINAQRDAGVGEFQTQQRDIAEDQTRLSANLESNLDFLGETFALGGDINAASQRLAQQQAAIEARAQQRANFLGGAGTGASLAAMAGGGPMAIIGAAILGGVTGGDVDVGSEIENFFSF